MMEPLLLGVIRVGIAFPQNVQEPPLPGHVLLGPLFAPICNPWSNGAQILWPICCSNEYSLAAKTIMVVTVSPLASVRLITVILSSLWLIFALALAPFVHTNF